MLNLDKKTFFDKLLNTIIKIEDLNNNIIHYSQLDIKYVKSKKSSTYSWLLFIDNVPCTSIKRNYKITYKCICGSVHTILLRKFLRKTKINCQHCAQDKKFGGIGANNPLNPNKGKPQQITIKNFLNESSEFQEKYFQNHLTVNEFNLWLPYIYKINDIILTDDIRQQIIYMPYYPCNNQYKYTDTILLNSKTQSIHTIYLKCNICGKIHKVHTLNLKTKKPLKIKCKNCALTNTTFPIQKYLNTALTYQSSIEKKFLDICFDKKIKVLNGLKIPYFWNNKNHIYISDFYLPEYKIIIELKSYNIFYYILKNSGKLDAKIAAANNYCKNNNMLYKFIFDNEIQDFFNTLTNEIV